MRREDVTHNPPLPDESHDHDRCIELLPARARADDCGIAVNDVWCQHGHNRTVQKWLLDRLASEAFARGRREFYV
jgi:hypothetical protein